jgi:hypothetical protein
MSGRNSRNFPPLQVIGAEGVIRQTFNICSGTVLSNAATFVVLVLQLQRKLSCREPPQEREEVRLVESASHAP